MSVENTRKNEMRKKLVLKLLPVIRKEGIYSHRIDSIARYMDVSKATMYKYFSSKEDICECIVNIYVDYIMDIDRVILDETASLNDRFQKSFEQTLLIAFYISDLYLSELRAHSKDLYEKIENAHDERNSQLIQYYEQLTNEEIFNPVNHYLIVLQDWFLLRKLFDPAILIKMNITLNQALLDYYFLKKHQLIHLNYIDQIDDTKMHDLIKMIVKKFSKAM